MQSLPPTFYAERLKRGATRLRQTRSGSVPSRTLSSLSGFSAMRFSWALSLKPYSTGFMFRIAAIRQPSSDFSTTKVLHILRSPMT